MRYDDELEKYKFIWEHFYEWDPGYHKGIYEFNIIASKSGHVTQITGPYTFTLR